MGSWLNRKGKRNELPIKAITYVGWMVSTSEFCEKYDMTVFYILRWMNLFMTLMNYLADSSRTNSSILSYLTLEMLPLAPAIFLTINRSMKFISSKRNSPPRCFILRA